MKRPAVLVCFVFCLGSMQAAAGPVPADPAQRLTFRSAPISDIPGGRVIAQKRWFIRLTAGRFGHKGAWEFPRLDIRKREQKSLDHAVNLHESLGDGGYGS
jgi:hypothetical protein